MRGDRMVIDDPHPTMTTDEQREAVKAFLDALPELVRNYTGPGVIIMAKLHQGDE